MRVGLDEFPDGEAIRGFSWGDRNVLAHESSPCSICLDAQLGLLENGSGFEVRLDPVLAILSASAGIFESSPGGLRIIRHVGGGEVLLGVGEEGLGDAELLITMRPARICEATRRAR